MLDMPNSPLAYTAFYAWELQPYHDNDPTLFPSYKHSQPRPVATTKGKEEGLVFVIVVVGESSIWLLLQVMGQITIAE